MREFMERLEVRVSVVYGSVATLWIIFSDNLLGWLFASNPSMSITVSMLKGLGFVGITALALFAVLSAELRKRTRVEQALRRTITERQQAETALLEERNLLRTLIDTLPDRIFVKDSQGRFLINNTAHLASLGVTAQEAVAGKTDFEFFPVQEAERFFADAQQVIQTGQPVIHHDVAATDHPTGRAVWLDTTKTPLRDHRGQIIGLVGIIRDITEPKQIDAALRESNDRFETLFRYSPDAIFLMDFATLAIVDCNEAACQMNGYTREELIGQSVNMLNVAPNPEAVSQQLKERLRREGVLYLQQEHWRKDGSKITIENSVCFLSIAGRELLVGIDRDITERQRAEAALHASEARYRHLFQESPIALLEEDFTAVKGYLDGLRTTGVLSLDDYLREHPDVVAHCASLIHIINVNQAALDLYDAPSAESLYGGLDKLLVAEALPILREELVALAGAQSAFETEARGQTLKGQPIAVLIKLNIIHGYENTWARVLVSITDITERTQMEMTLKHSEARFRLLIEGSPMGIAIVRDGLPLYANQALLDLFGYRAFSELADTDLLERIAPHDRQRILPMIENGQQPLPLTLELLGQRIDETVFPALLRAGVLPLDDGPAYIVFVTDITERQRLEEERVTAERLQVELAKEKELSDLKDRFISMVSHEYRTPLAVILSSTDLLRSYADRLPLDRKQKLFDDIRIQVTYMSALLDDVLTIGKVQTGKLELNPVRIDVDTYCQTVFDAVQLADHGAHRFTWVEAIEPLGSVEVDEHLLQQILTNLLSNAAKYSSDGAEIRLEIQREKSILVVQVSDQGIGIPEEDQARVFEPFHRAANVGNAQGTGLGLTIVKHNVEALGGTISFRSEPGVGTVFTVRLPVASGAVKPSLRR